MEVFEEAIENIEGANIEGVSRAKNRLDTRMKPQGSLGKLEKIAMKIAGMTGSVINSANRRCHIIASADNGVIEEGVSSCPIEYTRIVSEAMLNQIAAIGILCRTVDADLKLVDVGIKNSITRKYPNLYNRNVSRGTKNLVNEPAMTREECIKAIEVGIQMIEENSDDYDIFSNGEMGIANTTTSSALLYTMTGGKDIHAVVGRGGGLSDEGLVKKKRIIVEAVEKYRLIDKEPIEILRHVGGLDIACMVGMYIGAAKCKKPMLIDGFISVVAALMAMAIEPKTKDYMIATHKSEEPGMKIALEMLDLEPMLDMEMRLGEGTGAVLAYPIVTGALEVIKGMKGVEEVYDLLG